MTVMPEVRERVLAVARERAARRRRLRRVVAAVAVSGTLGGVAIAATALDRHEAGGGTTAPRAAPPAGSGLIGVLRRPQAEADDVSAAQELLARRPSLLRGARVDGIRRLAGSADGTLWLVPVAAREGERLCLLRTDGSGGVARKCGTPTDLRRGDLRAGGYGLVPDGVATVRLTLPTGEEVDVEVRDNAYDSGIPTPRAEARWYDREGRPVGPPG